MNLFLIFQQKDADTELPDENEKQADEVTENDVAEIPVTVTDVDADGDAGAKSELFVIV